MSTPARIRQHLEAGNVELKNTLSSLVIDEADLILSYGYDEDVEKIVCYLPNVFQSYLMSATVHITVFQRNDTARFHAPMNHAATNDPKQIGKYSDILAVTS